MTKFELTILGSSSALPTSQRYPTAHVLNVHERFFLIDCGEGTQMQMRKYGQRFTRINHIFISHLHGDHYFGLIGLISTYVLLKRQADLHVYAHSMLPELLKPQLEHIGQNELSFKIIWHPLNFKKSAQIYEDDAVEVISFPVKHRIPCCGFLFKEKQGFLNLRKEKVLELNIPIKYLHLIKKGEDFCPDNGVVIPNSELTQPPLRLRSYAFCSDTAFVPEHADFFQNVDLLYHESTYDAKSEHLAAETTHSTSAQAAQMAKLSNAGRLIIGHFSALFKDLNPLLEEARQIFPNTDLAVEGAVFAVQLSRKNE
jgi:ribonuclease Z